VAIVYARPPQAIFCSADTGLKTSKKAAEGGCDCAALPAISEIS